MLTFRFFKIIFFLLRISSIVKSAWIKMCADIDLDTVIAFTPCINSLFFVKFLLYTLVKSPLLTMNMKDLRFRSRRKRQLKKK